MQKFSQVLYRFSSGWVTLAALIVFGLFTALVLPGQAAQAEAIGGEAGSPDLSFFYSTDALYTMAETYGEAGRAAYIRIRFSFDVIWPLVYTLFQVTAVSWLYGQILAVSSRWRLVNWIPIGGMIFDFLENLSAALVMYRYPALSPGVADLAPWFTMIKWILVGGSFGLIVVGGIARIIKKVQNES